METIKKNRILRTILFLMFWFVFMVTGIITLFMYHSGIMKNGRDYVWVNYLQSETYEDVKLLVESLPKDLENLDRYVEQEFYYNQKGLFKGTNLQYVISSEDGLFSDFASDGFNSSDRVCFANTSRFEIPYFSKDTVEYTFSEDEFDINHLDGIIGDGNENRFMIDKTDGKYHVTLLKDTEKNTGVIVRYYIPEDMRVTDRYSLVFDIISVIYVLRNIIIALMIISLVVCIILLISLVVELTQSENNTVRFADRVPFDIYLLFTVAGIVLCIKGLYFIYGLLPELTRFSAFVIYVLLAILLCNLTGGLFLEFFLTMSLRIKNGTWFTESVFYKVVKRVHSNFRTLFIAIVSKHSYNRVLYVFLMFDTLLVLLFSVLSALAASVSLIVAGIITILAFLIFQFIVIYNISRFEKSCEMIASGSFDPEREKKSSVVPTFNHLKEAIDHIYEGMDIAVKDRIKSEHFKTELITNVSHDIKTPLTSIISYSDLLQKKSLSEEEKKEYLGIINTQSVKLKKLITDLVETSKAQTGTLELNNTPVDFKMLVEQSLAEYEDRFAEKNLKTVFNSGNGGNMVMADGQYLFRVIDNLLSNIYKYSMENTRVYIDVISCYDTVEVVFRNVSKYEIEASADELTERFVRGDSSRHMEGSGLGLSIARNLIEAMGGKLYLDLDADLFKSTIILDRIKDEKV
ncbi:MAG: HAMP domain-containing histidine kinase [Lachnospiraceae bacterium]|nr:HAMP domain-containing histidine kinase [Lachnospiraceae bacterium]